MISRVDQGVDHPPTKYWALSSTLSTSKKNFDLLL
jgi:hypothetical protein